MLTGLAAIGGALNEFCKTIMNLGLFQTQRKDSSAQAPRYLGGLVSEAQRKNIEVMNRRIKSDLDSLQSSSDSRDSSPQDQAETAPAKAKGAKKSSAEYDAMQHFISKSPWDARRVFDFVAAQADGRLGSRPDSMLIIDESAVTKKGKASVGVARQHNGRLGKQDNCQVGVHSVLNCGVRSAMIGSRLFLPDEWVEDPERCKKVGVPEKEIKKRTKIELARELIEQAIEQKVRFSCVGVDAFYGRDSTFLEWMNDENITYYADVPANALVFAREPDGEKRPAKMKGAAVRIDLLGKTLIESEPGQMVDLREGENGLVRVEVWAREVWVWPTGRATPRKCTLIVRRSNSDQSIKITLSNADLKNTGVERLARCQGSRFFVERTFQDGKSHVGMGQYQVRGWLAWHHHMAMVALALLFIMEQRMLLAESAPLLSAADIVKLLDWHLARQRTQAESIAAIEESHRQRQQNTRSAQKRARENLNSPRVENVDTFVPK